MCYFPLSLSHSFIQTLYKKVIWRYSSHIFADFDLSCALIILTVQWCEFDAYKGRAITNGKLN